MFHFAYLLPENGQTQPKCRIFLFCPISLSFCSHSGEPRSDHRLTLFSPQDFLNKRYVLVHQELKESKCLFLIFLALGLSFTHVSGLSLFQTDGPWNTSSRYTNLLPAHEECFVLMMFPFQLFYCLPLLFLTDNFFLQQSREGIKRRMLHMLSSTRSICYRLVLYFYSTIICHRQTVISSSSYSPPGEELYKVCRPGGGASLGCPAIEKLGFRIQAKSLNIIIII